MDEKVLSITNDETTSHRDDRFHRLRLIGWWDQERLARAKVLVIGAGALGNEIVKNLALLGIGHVLIADLDRVENSNLSRSILYRAADNGRLKAEVAAQAAREIYPQMQVHHFNGNIVYDLGMGVYRWADVVLAGLDNREARLAINRACLKANRPWIDGAIEQIQGCARVFVPDGPCYECTMSEIDWRILERRRSCNLLTRSEMEHGKTPTTPTISSVIAGVQCQEAVKLLHNLPTLAGRGWFFEGLSGESYQVEYQRKEECYSHDTLDEIVPLSAGHDTITARELLEEAQRLAGSKVELELGRDVLEKLVCPQCSRVETMFASLGKVREAAAWCPDCTGVRREVNTFYKIRGNEPFLDRTLKDIGIPAMDIVVVRVGDRSFGLELSGDSQNVLGALVGGQQELDWS
jgi:adenylyltransferase/sulfurtransferase